MAETRIIFETASSFGRVMPLGFKVVVWQTVFGWRGVLIILVYVRTASRYTHDIHDIHALTGCFCGHYSRVV